MSESNPQSQQVDVTKEQRELLYNIFTHDYAEKAHIARMAMAKGFGLSRRVTMPFPQLPSSNTTVNVTGGGRAGGIAKTLGAMALGAGLLGAGGLGAAAVMGLLPKTPTAPIVAPIAPASQPAEFDFVEQVLADDGTWKPTGVVSRKRLNPDGSTQTRQPDGSWK